jgi:hypothetical protein
VAGIPEVPCYYYQTEFSGSTVFASGPVIRTLRFSSRRVITDLDIQDIEVLLVYDKYLIGNVLGGTTIGSGSDWGHINSEAGSEFWYFGGSVEVENRG